MTLRLRCSGFEKMVHRFVERGLLHDSDVYPVDVLADRAGEARPEVLCALAFCLRASRHGHAGLWLGRRALSMLESEMENDGDRQLLRQWLGGAGVESWPELLRDSGLVATELSEHPSIRQGYRPFVLLDGSARPCGDDEPARLVQLKHYLAERYIAERFGQMSAPSGPVSAEKDIDVVVGEIESRTGVKLEPEQRCAIEAVLGRRLVVLTGGPGTGKTFTLGLLVRAWCAVHAGDAERCRIALAAPTGKAADRLHRVLAAQGDYPEGFARLLQHNRPRTLHRLLGAVPGKGFKHGPNKKLPHGLVVVDETSMVDLLLMKRLCEALSVDAHLVLVGDAEQLASVEVGCVLGDVVGGLEGKRAGGVAGPVVRLRRIHRTDERGGLAAVAGGIQALGRGAAKPEDVLAAIDSTEEIEFIRSFAEHERLLQALAGPYDTYLAKCGKAAASASEENWRAMLRAFAGYRIVSPFRRGPLGVDGLNAMVERKLAELFEKRYGRPGKGAEHGWFDLSRGWYPGRAVIVTENRYDLGLFNGDVGVVVFDGTAPVVVFPSSGGEEGLRVFSPARLPPCETVFATTVHKAQGSEYDEVAVVLAASDSPVLTRELVYTAVTRARRKLSIYADPAIVAAALSRPIQRASGLRKLLAGHASASTNHSAPKKVGN